MTHLGIALLWCALQVTLVSLIAAGCYLAVKRWATSTAAVVPQVALLLVVGLSATALSPWPQWDWSATVGSPSEPIGPLPGEPHSDPQPSAQEVDENPDTGGSAQVARLSSPGAENEADGETAARSREASHDPALNPGLLWQAFVEELQRQQRGAGASVVEFADRDDRWRWPAILATVFLVGLAAGSIRLGAGLWAVRSCCRSSRPVEDASLRDLLDVLRAELPGRKPVLLRESDRLATAATVGWRRPIILLPPDWRTWTEAQRRAVLAHEMAHIARNDFLGWIGAQLGVVLHFYHPLVHWLCGRLRLEQEFAADAAAARLAGGQQSYLQTLADLALRQADRPLPFPARTFLPTRHTFLRRIEMLHDAKILQGTLSRGKRWALVGVLLAAGVTAAGLRGPTTLQTTPNSAARTDDEASVKTPELSPTEQKLLGSWRGGGLMPYELTFHEDRTFHFTPALPQFETDVEESGTWKVEDGRLIREVRKSDVEDHLGTRERTILKLDKSVLQLGDSPLQVGGELTYAKRWTYRRVEADRQAGDRGEAQETPEGKTAAQDTAASDRPPLSLAWVPRNVIMLLAARPAELLEHSDLQPVADALQKGGVQSPFGIPLSDVEQLTLVFLPQTPHGSEPDQAGYIFQMTEPLEMVDAESVLGDDPERIEHAGATYYRSSRQRSIWVYRPNDETVIVSEREPYMQQIISAGATGAAEADWATHWKSVQNKDIAVLVNAKEWGKRLDQALRRNGRAVPDMLAMFAPLWRQSKTAEAGAELNEQLTVQAAFHCPNREDAVQVRNTLSAAATLSRNLLRQARPVAARQAGEERGAAAFLKGIKLGEELLDHLSIEQKGERVLVHSHVQSDGVARLVASTVLSLQNAREAARQVQSAHNLKQLAAALLSYCAQHDNRFPPAVITHKDGKKLEHPHSWRMAILPYLDRGNLYEKYRFDEPWDSEHNKQILERMPAVFRHPHVPEASTNTAYFALVGPGTVFDGEEGTEIREIQIRDGAANTILLVEAKRDIPWTKPQDISYDPEKPLPELGGYFKDEFPAAFCDGSVMDLNRHISKEDLRALITKSGGESIERP